MLKENNQLNFCLSSHVSLFDVLIEKDNFWRQLKDMVDFSFVYDKLKDKYSSTMGRKAEDVIRMFRYLLLKNYYKLIAKTVEIALEEKLSTQKIKMQKLDTKQLIHLSLGIKRILQ